MGFAWKEWIAFMICLAFLLFFIIVGKDLISNRENSAFISIGTNTEESSANSRNDTLVDNLSYAIRYHLPRRSLARCIDGSTPAFYYRKGILSGQNKWLVYFEGGGWCYDYEQCRLRGRTVLGSSKEYPANVSSESYHFYMSGMRRENPLMWNWNLVHVRYCDGGSYASDMTVKFKGNTLYFRGRHNRDETIQMLLAMGMNKAAEVVLMGCSAGGLALYMGIDHMARLIQQENSRAVVRGISDSGFFLDHNSRFKAPMTNQPQGKDEAVFNGVIDYGSAMRKVFIFMNLSSGTNQNCLRNHLGQNKSNCVFAAHITKYIDTPLFAIQPIYDLWQILHILGPAYTSPAVNEYGKSIITQMMKSLLRNSKHGAFLESCAHHCVSCSVKGEDSWHGSRIHTTSVDQLTEADAFELWYTNSISVSHPKAYAKNSLVSIADYNMFTGKHNQQLVKSNKDWMNYGSMKAKEKGSKKEALVFAQYAEFPCNECCICRLPFRKSSVQSLFNNS